RWNGRGVPRRTQRPDGGTAALFADRSGDGHARASGDTAAGAARGAAVHTRRASRLRQGAGTGRAAVRRRLNQYQRLSGELFQDLGARWASRVSNSSNMSGMLIAIA